jgi:endonuclease/exonuclease/phosphatase family metal-dependent hydrolase
LLNLVTANIEGDLHLDLVKPFLDRENPDVVCLQEIFEQDVSGLVGNKFQSAFLPMCLKFNREGKPSPWGVAIASRLQVVSTHQNYYRRPVDRIITYDHRNKRDSLSYGFVGIRLDVDGLPINIITTHFTWTPDGLADADQDEDMANMLALLAREPPHILCGDFNVPRRQNRLYGTLTERYTDHVPQEIASSIYVPFHYGRHKPGGAEKLSTLMVDYIFSTPGTCRVEAVALHGGISDHCAITAKVTPPRGWMDHLPAKPFKD